MMMKSLRIALLLCISAVVMPVNAQLKVKAFKKNGYFGLRAQLEEESFVPHLYEQLVVPVIGTIQLEKDSPDSQIEIPVLLRSAEWVENYSIPGFITSPNGFYKANTELLIRARKNARWGLVSWDGKEIAPCLYDSVNHYESYISDLDKHIVIYELYSLGKVAAYASATGMLQASETFRFLDMEHPWVYNEVKESRKHRKDTVQHILLLASRGGRKDTVHRHFEHPISLMPDPTDPEYLIDTFITEEIDYPWIRNGEFNLVDLADNRLVFKTWAADISFPNRMDQCLGEVIPNTPEWGVFSYTDTFLLPYTYFCPVTSEFRQHELITSFFVTQKDGLSVMRSGLHKRRGQIKSNTPFALIHIGYSNEMPEYAWISNDRRGARLFHPRTMKESRLLVKSLDPAQAVIWLDRPYYKAVNPKGNMVLIQPKSGDFFEAKQYQDISLDVPQELQADSMAIENGPLCLLKSSKGWTLGYLGLSRNPEWGMDSLRYFGKFSNTHFWLGYRHGSRFLLSQDGAEMELGEARSLLTFSTGRGFGAEMLDPSEWGDIPEVQFTLLTNAIPQSEKITSNYGISCASLEHTVCKGGTQWQVCNSQLEPMHTGKLEDVKFSLELQEEVAEELQLPKIVSVSPVSGMKALQQNFPYQTLPYVCARQGGRWGILLDGKGWIVNPDYETIEVIYLPNEAEHAFKCVKNGKVSYKDASGREFIVSGTEEASPQH